MGNGLISLLFAVGLATWIYTKLMRSTGGNQKSAITASAVSGVFVFIVFFTALSMIF